MDGHPLTEEELDQIHSFKDKEIKPKMSSHLKLVTGGGDTPEKTGNWLKDMEIGTAFFTKASTPSKDFNLQPFHLVGKEGVHLNVICLTSPLLPKEIYVDPDRFCQQFTLHHVIGVIGNKEEEQEDVNEDHRTPSPEGEATKDLGEPNRS